MERQEKSFAVNELFGHALSGAVGAFLVWLALFAIVDLVSGDLSPAGLFARGRRAVLIWFSYMGLSSGAVLYARKVRQVKFYVLVGFLLIIVSCTLGPLSAVFFADWLFMETTFKSDQPIVGVTVLFLVFAFLGVLISFVQGCPILRSSRFLNAMPDSTPGNGATGSVRRNSPFCIQFFRILAISTALE